MHTYVVLNYKIKTDMFYKKQPPCIKAVKEVLIKLYK